MGKRSDFERRPQDFYRTPPAAIPPLLPHLLPLQRYGEPCAGDGALLDLLPLVCVDAWDIEPRDRRVERYDALTRRCPRAQMYITNPPWRREVLHPLIEHLSDHRPTWLLLDADWMHTKQAAPYAYRCVKVVSVGRLKWIEGSAHTGKDNCAWFLFDGSNTEPTRFYWRV